MQESSALKVVADVLADDGTLVMNPNDGFDLGLMNTRQEALMVFSPDADTVDTADAIRKDGLVELANDRGLGTCLLSARIHRQLGSPASVRVYRDNESPRPTITVLPAQ